MKVFVVFSLVSFTQLLGYTFVDSLCPNDGEGMTIAGSCSYSNILDHDCDPLSFGMTEEEVSIACDLSAVTFATITGKGYQFDKEFMDGGGPWNHDERQTYHSVHSGRIHRFENSTLRSSRILWTEYKALELYSLKFGGQSSRPYMSNFHLDESCDLRTVMCCFANTTPVFTPTTTTTTTMTTTRNNSRVCNIELQNSQHSNHIRGKGYGVYGNNTTSFCTGFSWSADESHATAQYKGNSLFDVAFRPFAENGFVKNIPGAPLCACLEQMPAVTNSGCRLTSVSNETYTLQRTGNTFLVAQNSVTVSFSSCGDLKTYVQSTSNLSTEQQGKLDRHLVGKEESCKTSNDAFLNNHFLIDGGDIHLFDYVGHTNGITNVTWDQVAGLGLSFWPVDINDTAQRDVDFRRKLAVSPNKIVYRKCESCLPSHQHIYYRRITEIPPYPFDFLNSFLNNWLGGASNVLNLDYELYSTYHDAVHRNPKKRWQYCTYTADQGFPNNCGPKSWSSCQWSHYKKLACSERDYNALSHGFYVEQQKNTNNEL